jgi:hypothetical protein
MEKAMNIDTISSTKPLPDARSAAAAPEPVVIKLDEIKSILFLGMKGELRLGLRESHRVDTFA